MGFAVAVAGASGLVGGRLLNRLLQDPEVERVVAPTRRALSARAKLDNPRLASRTWPALPPIEEAYCALGTTRAKAGSDAAFRAVDFELALSFARAARSAGAVRFGLVSSVGADAGSRFLYPRVKGEVEAAVAGLGFPHLVVGRPSFLLGARGEERRGEAAWIAVFSALAPLIPERWRAVSGDAVAAGLIATVRGRVPGTLVLESDTLRRWA